MLSTVWQLGFCRVYLLLMFINSPRQGLKRDIGVALLCIIGISGTIGGSIFVLLAGGVELAGAYTPLAFLLGGALALLGGLLYAEVGTTIPRPGADLAYVFTAFKKRVFPFLFSWTVLLGDIGYLAINALGFGFYLGLVLGVSPLIISLAALVAAAGINIKGIRKAGKAEAVSVTILLLLFCAYAVYVTQSPYNLGSITFDEFRITGVLAATALIFTSFVGYEYVATLAGEAKNPGKTIPIALIVTILVSAFVFSAVAYITLLGASQETIAGSDAPLLAVAETLGGAGIYIVIPAALLATGGSLIAAVMITSRRLFAIAHEGFFGKFLTKTNRSKVPARAVVACSVFAALLVVSQAINFVAYMSNTVYLLGLINIAVSIMLLRKKRPYLPRPFRTPLFPLIPFAIIALASVLLFFVQRQSLMLVIVWVIIGWFGYLLGGVEKARWKLLFRGGIIFLYALLATILAVSYFVVAADLTQ